MVFLLWEKFSGKINPLEFLFYPWNVLYWDTWLRIIGRFDWEELLRKYSFMSEENLAFPLESENYDEWVQGSSSSRLDIHHFCLHYKLNSGYFFDIWGNVNRNVDIWIFIFFPIMENGKMDDLLSTVRHNIWWYYIKE